jgi:hypothetical protein
VEVVVHKTQTPQTTPLGALAVEAKVELVMVLLLKELSTQEAAAAVLFLNQIQEELVALVVRVL